MKGSCLAAVIAATVTAAAQMPPALRERDARMAELALEAAKRGPVAPIPLLAETSRPVGVVYDQYLQGVLLARARLAAGEPATVDAILADPLWQSRSVVIVAYPVNCDGRPNRPLAIRWTRSGPAPVGPTPIREPMRGAEASAVLPGVGLPDDALVVQLRNALLIGASVEIDYVDAVCRGAARTLTLPIAAAPSAALFNAFNGVKLPAEFASLPSPTTVRISLVLDPTGRPRFPQQVQGPAELGPAAMAAITARTFPPATMNGVAVPLPTLVPVVFTVDGSPGTVAPYVPTAAPGSGTIVMGSPTTIAVPQPAPPPPPVPPAPPGQNDLQLARLAIEVAAKGEPTPIPLDAAGAARHGVFFDRFLMAVVRARAAAASGAPMNSSEVPADLMRNDLVAVAFPLECSGRQVAPLDLQVSIGGARAGTLRAMGPAVTGPGLETRLPGVRLPAGAIGRPFAFAALSESLEVRVTYAEPPCGRQSVSLTFPLQWTRGSSMGRPTTLKMPPGVAVPSPATVTLRGLVDLDGAYRFPTIAEGPQELAVVAAAAAAQWRFQPYRVNGVASPQVVLTSLAFTDTGAPAPPGSAPLTVGRGGRGAGGEGPGTTIAMDPPLVTTSTIGGRPSTQINTEAVAGLTAATSQCAIAEDDAYGWAPAGAIKVGGGAMDGPARARKYLSALRGPAGEGLQIIRLGTSMGPDRETILDSYQVTYASLPTPKRMFVDQYHEDATLKAPRGLVCATPVVR